MRSIEIIGEAPTKIPHEFRAAHAEIEWQAKARMRDRLIHDYLGTDYDLVWDMAARKIPILKKQIEEILFQTDVG